MVYISSFVAPEKLWFFSTIVLFYPILFFVNCFFITLWLFQDAKWMIPSTLTVLLGWSYTSGFIGINSSSVDESEYNIDVISYNTGMFTGRNLDGSKYKVEEAIEFLNGQNEVDIFCFQEYNTNYTDRFLSYFKGFNYVGFEDKRVSILSRFPVLNSGGIDFNQKTNSCVWADLLIKEDTVRIYSAHLQSSAITFEANDMLENIDIQERRTWREAKEILSKYWHTGLQRVSQAKIIKEHMKKCSHPIILAGDMNEPPSSYTYNILCENMKDSFRSRASGIESTYGGRIPFLRIDYIFAQKSMNVIDYKTHKVGYSDHYPIQATFSF